MREFLSIASALGDENRLRMLLALRSGELCVCEITEFSGLAPSTVSKHLSILRDAGLIDGRKEGRWVYYRLAGSDASPVVLDAIRWVQNAHAADPRVAQDAERIVEILKDRKKQCPVANDVEASIVSDFETVGGNQR